MEEKRVKLSVLGLSYSHIQTGAYALILAEVNGPRRIPVVIGESEAQSIAHVIEHIKPKRPLTHDLFSSMSHAFGIQLKEVFIYSFEDGIFSSELTFSDGDRTVVLDSRTSDAIGIAMRAGAPIYTTPEIVEQTGFTMEQIGGEEDDMSSDGSHDAEEDTNREPRLENYTIDELRRTLDKLIASEEYEEAAKVNEILQRKLADRQQEE